MECKEIVQRFDYLKAERQGSVEQIWDLVERFVVPLRGDFYTSLNSEHEVDWHRRGIYDSTAVFSAQSLAAALQGNLTSPAQRWFDLRFRDNELNADDAAKESLDDCTGRIYNALGEANFDVEIAEAYIDIVAFGTSVLTAELDEADQKLNFSAVPVREVYFEEDHKKKVYRFYRHLQWTPIQIAEKFGDDIPQVIKDKLDNPASSTEKMDVVFCIFPRKTSKDLDTSKPIAPQARPFGYKYVLKTAAEPIGKEGGYYEMPSFVARWSKTAGSRWGHSPATIAMADILTLNQVKEATLEAAGKAIDPANLVEETALLGDLDLDRGAMTVVTNIDGIRPYESGSKFDVSNMEIGMLTDTVRKAFFQDQLELKESPQMTATEVNVRYELMQRLLGSTFARLKSDLLDPLVKRCFGIMFRAGQFIEMPPEVGAADIDISYSGPLARSQQMDSAMAIQSFLMGTAQLAQAYPSALDIIDVDGALRQMAILQGVPAKALKGEKQIAQERKARQEEMAKQEEVMQAQATGDAMQSMGAGAEAMGNVTDITGAMG